MSILPEVSIVVPVYNVEKYLQECLDSLINQSCQNIEIILVDDGSSDSSGDICEEYKRKDHRIKVIHKKNEGQHIARLRGLQKAKAPYAMFCDSDDYVHFQMVEIFLDLIKAYKMEFIGFDVRGKTTVGCFY